MRSFSLSHFLSSESSLSNLYLITSGLKIVSKLEEWFLILGVFFLSEDH